MTLCSLILFLGVFVSFNPLYAKISSINELSQVQNERTIFFELDTKINEMEVQMHGIPRPETANKTTYVNAHEILILIGWGTLLPIGVIIARYFRMFTILRDVWFKCHLVCQTSGYILGTIGWCIGMLSKHLVSKTQSTLSIITFTFINVQMLGTLMRLHKELGYSKWWNIYHLVVGYAVIGMVIANIFAGFHHETLKRVYEGILGVFTVVVVPLEIYKCKNKILHRAVSIHLELWNREGS